MSRSGSDLFIVDNSDSDWKVLHPTSLARFLNREKGELFARPALEYLREQLPPAFFTNPLETSNFLRSEPASKTLLPELLMRAELVLPKSDCFIIASQMLPEEIPIEVEAKLDAIQNIVDGGHS